MLRYLLISLVSLCTMAACWLFHRSNEHREIMSAQRVQQSMADLQEAEHRSNRLDKGHANPLLSVLGEDVVDLQIRLSETFSQWQLADKYQIVAYEQQELSPIKNRNDGSNVSQEQKLGMSILRLDVQMMLSDASELLRLLEDLKNAAGGWPLDIRACDMRLMPELILDSRCVVDVYYWRAESGA